MISAPAKFRAWTILVMFASTLPSLAFAQQLRNGEEIGDWVYECVAVTEQEAICAISQSIYLQDTSAPLVRISLSRGETPTQIFVRLLTPLNVRLQEGASVMAGQEGLTFPFFTCVASGCLARGSVDGSAFRDLVDGSEMSIAFSSLLIEGVTVVPFSTNGLLAALDRANFGVID